MQVEAMPAVVSYANPGDRGLQKNKPSFVPLCEAWLYSIRDASLHGGIDLEIKPLVHQRHEKLCSNKNCQKQRAPNCHRAMNLVPGSPVGSEGQPERARGI